jgi:hypothetical protein
MSLKNENLIRIKRIKKPTEVIDKIVNKELDLDCSVKEFLSLLTRSEDVTTRKINAL